MKRVLTCTLALALGEFVGAKEPPAVTAAARKFEMTLEATEEPRKKLDASYESRLKELKKAAGQSGDLESVLLIQKELESFRKRARPKIPAAAKDLSLARNKYDEARRAMLAKENKLKQEVMREFAAKLEAMVAAYTRDRKIDEAVATRERLQAIQKRLAFVESRTPRKSAGSGSGTELQVKTVGGCRMTSTPQGYHLYGVKKDSAYMQTLNEFQVPLVIRTRVKTDSTNIRVYFGKGFFILNWELRQSELRVHDPLTGRQKGVAKKGKVTPDEFHDIEWEILENGMTIKVDGRTIFRNKNRYTGLKSPVGIGPAHGSQLIVGTLNVEER